MLWRVDSVFSIWNVMYFQLNKLKRTTLACCRLFFPIYQKWNDIHISRTWLDTWHVKLCFRYLFTVEWYVAVQSAALKKTDTWYIQSSCKFCRLSAGCRLVDANRHAQYRSKGRSKRSWILFSLKKSAVSVLIENNYDTLRLFPEPLYLRLNCYLSTTFSGIYQTFGEYDLYDIFQLLYSTQKKVGFLSRINVF